MVSFEMQADVVMRDEAGVRFEGRDLDWKFTANSLGFGGTIVSRAAQAPLCMRFDQAHVSSNLHPQAVPLAITYWVTIRDGQRMSLGSTIPKHGPAFAAPRFCLEPGKEAIIFFWPDLDRLFPTQKMFNVQWPAGNPVLSDKGIGNWIAISVPVEVGDKRQRVEVKLTAVEARGSLAYW